MDTINLITSTGKYIQDSIKILLVRSTNWEIIDKIPPRLVRFSCLDDCIEWYKIMLTKSDSKSMLNMLMEDLSSKSNAFDTVVYLLS